MEKSLPIALFFFIQMVLFSPIFASVESPKEGNYPNNYNACDAPAPDSFRITNTTLNSISLAWQPIIAGALHTLEILEKDNGGGWNPIDTISNLPGSSYTISGLQFGFEYRFIIATNCPNGEPSMKTSIIDGIVSIIELVLGGRTPLNPVVQEGCPAIDYLAHNWVGFKVERIGGGSTNFFEFGIGEYLGHTIPQVKRTIYGPSLVVGNKEFEYPEIPDPTVITIEGNTIFNVFLVKGAQRQEIGKLELTFDESNHIVKICKVIGENWNTNFSFYTLTASEANIHYTSEERLSEDSSINRVAIFQNPFVDILKISHIQQLADQQDEIVSLINTNGQIVLKQKINLSSEISLQVGHLSPGFYILQIESSNQVKSFKVLKSE